MPQSPGRKVLVADDERAIAETLGAILTRSGFETRRVYSGEAAVQIAEHFRPNMLITDVVMPGISGIEAAIRITAMLPACKILLFSGQAKTVDLLKQARLRGYDFEIIAKPVHPRDLLDRLRNPAVAA